MSKEPLDRQKEHLDTVLKEKRLNQAEFADSFGFSTSSVSEWMNGKRPMSDRTARVIHERWPEYSPDWLRGYDLGRNPSDNFLETIAASREESNMMLSAFFYLAKLNGFTVSLPFYEAAGIEEIVSSIKDDFATISRDGVTVKLGMDDFYELQNQFVDYAGMRLGRIIRRGEW